VPPHESAGNAVDAETAELFVPTLRAFYRVVSEPSEETWLEQALPYAIVFKPPAD
jgi:hypothetical protein